MSEAGSIRVLIAEDHLIARVGLATIIREEPDMTVVAVAANGEQAVELYRKLQPDVVLMDVRMPVMNGIDAVHAIRSEFPLARILILSTYNGDADISRAFAAGVRAYLKKDIQHDELIYAIRAVHNGQNYLPAPLEAVVRASAQILSHRETEVLKLVIKGLSNKRIAYSLEIAENTVANHLKKILEKLGVSDRTQAATVAIQRGIIHLPD